MKPKNIDITSTYPYEIRKLLKLKRKVLYQNRIKLPNNFYLYFLRIRGNFKYETSNRD